MKTLTVTTLLLLLLVGCGQTGPLRPAEDQPTTAEADA